MSLWMDMLLGVKINNPMEIVKMEQATLVDYGKPLVIYHGNCADGFSAAWCFHRYTTVYGGRGFDFHAGVYNDPPPDVNHRIVFLVDFSYKRAVVEKMLEDGAVITLIDHHKTAIEDLADLVHPNFYQLTDLERSGAMLAWDFLFNRTAKVEDFAYVEPPKLLGHVQDRDLWKFKLPLTREIQANVFSYEYTFENWDKLMLETSTITLAEGGTAIERKHFKDIRELIAVAERKLHIGDHYVPVLNCPYFFSSDAGHIMAANHADGKEFAACYFDTKEHRIFSLRSTENGMDVSLIAKQYGGGGHKNAAGFRVPRTHYLATE